jgi:hypothetical protein
MLVPGMETLRVPARALFLANLAAAVLAGLGVDALRPILTDPPQARRLARRIGILAISAGIAIFVLRLQAESEGARPRKNPSLAGKWPSLPLPADNLPPAPPRLTRPAGIQKHEVDAIIGRIVTEPPFWISATALLALAVIAGPGRLKRHHALTARLLGLIALAEVTWYGNQLIRTAPADRFVGPSPIESALSDLRLSRGDDLRLSARIKARDNFYGDLTASCDRVEKININDAFQLDHAALIYQPLYSIASHVRPMAERVMTFPAKENWRTLRRAILDRWSVEFVVSDRLESDPAWPIAREGHWNGRPFVIQQNHRALPRAYVVPRAITILDQPERLVASLLDIDPRRAVILDQPQSLEAPGQPGQEFRPAQWLSTDPDRPAFRVYTTAPGWLVISDTWMPGWSATLNGVPVPVLRGNLAQRVIRLPGAGDHHIAMSYDPPGLALGIIITASSLSLWLAACATAVCHGLITRRSASRSLEFKEVRGAGVEVATKSADGLQLVRVDRPVSIQHPVGNLNQQNLPNHEVRSPGSGSK